MKRILLTLTLLFTTSIMLNSFAQTPQVNNTNFEDWENVGTDDEEPLEWNSFGTASGTWASFAQKGLQRSTDIRTGATGSYCAKIWANSIMGTIANGNLTTGQINMGSTTPSSTSNYNITRTANTAYNEALTAVPDSLVVWVKTVISNASHTPRIHATVHDNYDMRDPTASGSESHIVAEATLNYTTTGGVWVRKSIPFIDGAATTPSYIIVSFTTCSTPGTGTANDYVLLDDLLLVYNPTLTTGTLASTDYTVATDAGASISIPFTLTGTMYADNVVSAQLSDASGSFASPIVLGSVSATTSGTITGMIPANTPTGSGYRVRVVSTTYAITAADNGVNVQITLASNAAAPSTAQTVEAGTSGTAITVTENGTPVEREWQYATTSGGPYSSFITPETGTTYTPNFASAGTYYVVCTTTWPPFLQVTSNEVMIEVADNAISPSSTQTIWEETDGTPMTLTETPAGTSREWKYATVSGGPYTSFTPAETNATYTPFFMEPGTYYVIAQSVYNGVTITSPEVTIIVDLATGVEGAQELSSIMWDGRELSIDLSRTTFNQPVFTLVDMNGRRLHQSVISATAMNRFRFELPAGVYIYTIQDAQHSVQGKFMQQ